MQMTQQGDVEGRHSFFHLPDAVGNQGALLIRLLVPRVYSKV